MSNSLFEIAWAYYTLDKEGYLLDEEGDRAFDRTFDNAQDAEEFLSVEDIRGTVL